MLDYSILLVFCCSLPFADVERTLVIKGSNRHIHIIENNEYVIPIEHVKKVENFASSFI